MFSSTISFHFQAKDYLDKFPASAGPDLAQKWGKENLADAAPLQSTSNDLVMVAELQKVGGLRYKNFSKPLQLDLKNTFFSLSVHFKLVSLLRLELPNLSLLFLFES